MSLDEVAYQFRHVVDLLVQQKMTAIEQVQLRVGDVGQVRACAGFRKEPVVAAPWQ